MTWELRMRPEDGPSIPFFTLTFQYEFIHDGGRGWYLSRCSTIKVAGGGAVVRGEA